MRDNEKSKQQRVRLTVDLPKALNDTLQSIADEQGLTKTDILRKAVAMFDVAHQATVNKKGIAIVDGNGKIEERIVGI
jgi:hypothetical protein